jgi:D-3-phosphoglycerate dehydrogenase
MAKVVIADGLHADGAQMLANIPGMEVVKLSKPTAEEVMAAIADAEALIVRSATKVTEAMLQSSNTLKLVGRAGIGVDNIDLAAASRRGVLVINAPNGNSITTAEHAISLMTSLARNIPQATASMRAGKWEKKKFMGFELFEHTLGVIGFGKIGQHVAKRAIGLGMKVIAHDPYATAETAAEVGAELVDLDTLYAQADVLTLHLPVTESTRHMVNAAAFAKMKKGMRIVNAARGGIVDEAALCNALDDGTVVGAAFDVFEKEPISPDHPLLGYEQVILTPHLGASTAQAQQKVATEMASGVIDYLVDGTIRNPVNLPAARGETPDDVQPYLQLAERLGRFQAQFFGGLTGIKIVYAGDAFKGMTGRGLVTSAAVQGLLDVALPEPVSLVNAPLLAGEHGIKVEEAEATSQGNFKNYLQVTVSRDSGESSTVCGAVFAGGEPRVVQIDDFALEAKLQGHMLVIGNVDKPGVIGKVGTILGNAQINVARLHVGVRHSADEKAIALWTVDGEVSSDVLGEIRSHGGVSSVNYVTF